MTDMQAAEEETYREPCLPTFTQQTAASRGRLSDSSNLDVGAAAALHGLLGTAE